MITLDQRIEWHKLLADTCSEIAKEHGHDVAAPWRIAQAIHELGVTTALAARGQQVDSADLEQLGQDLSQLHNVTVAHRGAIEKAMKGLSPWGELRDSTIALERAIEKVMKR